MALSVNTDDLKVFIDTLFINASPNTYIILRTLRDDNSNKTFEPQRWTAHAIPEDKNFAEFLSSATESATRAANAPVKVVFCPPICTFHQPGQASEENVANGLVLMIECDQFPQRALEMMEDLLGPASIVMASGGTWTNPTSGHIEEKIHAHWVLSSPTITKDQHALLREARSLATDFVEGDATAKPLSHPFRWAGSWHRKAEPRLSRIIRHSQHQIDLEEALSLLRSVSVRKSTTDDLFVEADIVNIKGALDTIPNHDDTDWDTWNTIGMASFSASGGSKAGLDSWTSWSQKSSKHSDQQCAERWRHYKSSPPTKIGVGYLYKQAKIANPKWRPPSDSTPPGAYQRDRNGSILANRHNIATAFRRFQVELSYDAFVDKMLLNGEATSEKTLRSLWFRIESEEYFKPVKEYFMDACEDIAMERTIHPVQDYLNSLVWDDTPRIDTWLIDIAGAIINPATHNVPTNRPYVEAVSRLILLGGVARILDPGCKFDEMLVLVSPRQGTNKSSALRTLAVRDEWFSDSLVLTADEKEVLEHSIGKWIMETSELSGMKQHDIETLKAFLSRQTDRARMAYGRFVTERPRTCIYWGTTNNTAFLRDEQNRRFWPVRVLEFDIELLRRVRDQLWAEAVHRFKAGESTRLDPALYNLAEFEQDKYRLVDGMEVRLERYFGFNSDGEPCITGRVVSDDVMRIAVVRNKSDEIRVGEAMRRMGWEHDRKGFGSRRYYVYTRGTERQREEEIYVYPNFDSGWTVTHSRTPSLEKGKEPF